MLDLDLRGDVMLIKEFIHSDRIYSKCTEEEKRRIDTKLDSYEVKMKLLEYLTKNYDELYEKYALLEKENKQLIDRISKLESSRWNDNL